MPAVRHASSSPPLYVFLQRPRVRLVAKRQRGGPRYVARGVPSNVPCCAFCARWKRGQKFCTPPLPPTPPATVFKETLGQHLNYSSNGSGIGRKRGKRAYSYGKAVRPNRGGVWCRAGSFFGGDGTLRRVGSYLAGLLLKLHYIVFGKLFVIIALYVGTWQNIVGLLQRRAGITIMLTGTENTRYAIQYRTANKKQGTVQENQADVYRNINSPGAAMLKFM